MLYEFQVLNKKKIIFLSIICNEYSVLYICHFNLFQYLFRPRAKLVWSYTLLDVIQIFPIIHAIQILNIKLKNHTSIYYTKWRLVLQIFAILIYFNICFTRGAKLVRSCTILDLIQIFLSNNTLYTIFKYRIKKSHFYLL